jgi:hypothetical protein
MWKPLLAAAGGAVVGFFVAKTHYEKAAYAYANERIEQAKVYAEERAEREIAKFQVEATAEAYDAVTAVYEADTDKMAKLVEENEVIAGLVTNYKGFSEMPQAPENVDPEDSESHIVLIRRKEFFEGPLNDNYHQVSVTYYQLDDILVDPSDKQLDVRAAIGSIRPSWFGNEAEDEDVVYVRNTQSKIEFEVIRSLESFSKVVLGRGEEE